MNDLGLPYAIPSDTFTEINWARYLLDMAQRFVDLVQTWTASMGIQAEVEAVKR